MPQRAPKRRKSPATAAGKVVPVAWNEKKSGPWTGGDRIRTTKVRSEKGRGGKLRILTIPENIFVQKLSRSFLHFGAKHGKKYEMLKQKGENIS